MKLLKIVGLATLSSALALGAASAQGKKWDTVKIATEGAYAPWNFTRPAASSKASRSTSPTSSAPA